MILLLVAAVTVDVSFPSGVALLFGLTGETAAVTVVVVAAALEGLMEVVGGREFDGSAVAADSGRGA